MTAPSPDGPKRAKSRAWLLEQTERLCRHDTTTGREDSGLAALRELLESMGAKVELQRIARDRHNVLATWGDPQVVFSTHLDTVPPFLPPKRAGDVLSGRGTCDAKGQIIAQLGAIADLLAQGHEALGWLGVIGEETDSIGADAAHALMPQLANCRAIINGEPTENLLATGQRGSLQLKLSTQGVAAHSGMPELGRSAILPMLDWIAALRALPGATHKDLGDEIWNLGRLQGGSAPNVIPALAEAELFVRSLPESRFEQRVRELAPAEGLVERTSYTAPETFPRIPGFEHAVVPFGSDAPKLRQLIDGGTIALCGPGSIKVAHTLDEHITGEQLERGRDLLHALAQNLLAQDLPTQPR
ncbi:MAG: M20/M25/M40 family metallo-hydrolase [Planctomycetota bacterium]